MPTVPEQEKAKKKDKHQRNLLYKICFTVVRTLFKCGPPAKRGGGGGGVVQKKICTRWPHTYARVGPEYDYLVW